MDKNTWDIKLLRTFQYWFQDGIVELVMGGMALLAGIYFYLLARMANSPLAETLTVSFVMISVVGYYLMRFLIRTLKERITFPRTGYVAYRQGPGTRTVLILAILLTVILTIGLWGFSQVKLPQTWNQLPAFSGFVLACGLGLVGFQTALPRFYGLGLISLILGGAFAPLPLSNNLATAAFNGLMGLIFLASGAAMLRNYLRQHPAQTEAADDK